MDLWIRSQDKTDLIKVNALWIMDNQIWMEVPFYENHKKVGLSVTGNNHKLAQYKTKERALEVLDEIQKHLINNVFVKKQNGLGEIIDLIQNPLFVYEMPKE